MNKHIGDLAACGGHAKAARRESAIQGRVTILPPLTDLEAAQAWLWTIAELAASGLLAGSQAAAAARAVEIWVRAEHARLDRDRFRSLERQVEELDLQLTAARKAEGGGSAR